MNDVTSDFKLITAKSYVCQPEGLVIYYSQLAPNTCWMKRSQSSEFYVPCFDKQCWKLQRQLFEYVYNFFF